MNTPRSISSRWQDRRSAAVRVCIVLACLLLVVPAAGAQPPPEHDAALAAAPSLGQYLNPDGTLALPAGQAISLDPRGYQLVSGPGEAPRFAPAQPDANPGDENWASGLFPLRGMNGWVDALAVDAAGNLYAGGLFTTAGGVNANRIAKWDGTAWSALGSGMNDRVYTLAVDAAGNLYAGGLFTTAGGVSASRIAQWDGTAWSALGSGVSGGDYPHVSALAVDAAGNLYTGGNFATAGVVSANNIAKWDGMAWSALGSGMNNYVQALAMDATGNLYAGGNFTTAGGVSANRIAKWDGTAWSALGSGMNNWVVALAVDAAGNLYAGGGFTTAGGVSANRIAKWDRTAWSALGTGMNDYVLALALDAAGNVYAGGGFLNAGGVSARYIAKWDGNAWSALGSGMGGYVSALAVDAAGNLYAGGGFANSIAKWDGTAWSVLGGGMNDYVNALAVDAAGNLYAGGGFTTAGGVSANHIAKWDGTGWSVLGSGLNYSVSALAVDAAGNLYAGGWFTTAGGVSANHIAKWDGTAWSALGSGMSGMGDHVSALAVDAAGNLYAGGEFATAGGVSANNIAKWDGNAWSALGSGVGGPHPYVGALAVDAAGNLYAGGWFINAGGVSANRIAKWNGTAWSALGSGMSAGDYPYVYALAVDAAGNLYAGGGFTTAGGVNANYIAKWDGNAWSALGSGMDLGTRALAVDAAGNLYAGGDFTTAGGVSANYIAQWDGNAWSALGSGMGGGGYPYDPGVDALAVDAAGNLYAGGTFTTAGPNPSVYLARWTAADGVTGVATGSYTFYANNLPVTIRVVTPGTLNRLTLQRFNRSHPQAAPDLETGYYWEIAGTDAKGSPASGYVVDLTLPTTFTPDAGDQVCRFTGSAWDCAASAHAASSVTRSGITQLSDWTVANRPDPTLTPTPTPTAAPFFAWQVEAETGVLTAPMTTGSDPTASTCFFVHDTTSWSNGTVSFSVYVPYGGTYHLWARVMGLDWNHNSFFVSVDGSQDAVFEIPQVGGQWAWGWQRVAVDVQGGTAVNLGAGAHTIQFKRREAAARLDVVALTNDAGYAPTAITPCVPTATPTPTPAATPTRTPTATPTATWTPTVTPTATPSPTPIAAWQSRYFPFLPRGR